VEGGSVIQPSLFTADRPASVSRKRGHVPASSVEAYERLKSKDRRVMFAVDGVRTHPMSTSAELARRLCDQHFPFGVTTDDLLRVRRGLSDAQKLGLVEHSGKRICTVAGTLAVTWKVKSR
jgi:hypothetical protein